MEQKKFGCLNNFTLKIIAIVSMLIDHIGYTLFPQLTFLREIGRLAFPIFCFLIVEGFYHTRSHLNYLIRLSIFALLSEIPFDLAFYGVCFYWQHQNVFFTLALGLLSIFCLEEMNTNKNYVFLLVLVWIVSSVIRCDYSIGGVLLICLFYKTRNTPWVRFLLCALLLYVFYGSVEMYGLFALIPISLYNGKRGPSAKMLFYWFYPVHLFILYGIQLLLP